MQSFEEVITNRLFLGHTCIVCFPVIPSEAKENTYSLARALSKLLSVWVIVSFRDLFAAGSNAAARSHSLGEGFHTIRTV